jgi:putative MATE family efflux protein
MSTLFGMINMIMVGQLSAAAITAVGLTNQPFMLLLAVFAAVNVGTTALVAWNIGAGNTEKASAVTRQIIAVNIVLGLVMSTTGIVFSRYIVTFMGAQADTIEDATAYFRIVSSGLLFQAVTMGITASLRGAGETRIPMMYNIGSNLLNVFGNYLLIYGKLGFPELKVEGAAISTTFSRIVACLIGFYIISLSNKSAINIRHRGRYHPDFVIIKRVFSIGLPAAMEQFVIQSGLMIFARTVGAWHGRICSPPDRFEHKRSGLFAMYGFRRRFYNACGTESWRE